VSSFLILTKFRHSHSFNFTNIF